MVLSLAKRWIRILMLVFHFIHACRMRYMCVRMELCRVKEGYVNQNVLLLILQSNIILIRRVILIYVRADVL